LFCRAITELTEELKIKNEEGDAYISEIEVWFFSLESFLHYPCRGYWFHKTDQLTSVGTVFASWHAVYASKLFTDRNHFACQTIGQAYEDMQTQNQRLLQQITERDDYNSQVSGSCLHFCTSCSYVVGLPAYVCTSKCVTYYTVSVYEMGYWHLLDMALIGNVGRAAELICEFVIILWYHFWPFFVCPVKCLLACVFQLMSESLKAKQLQTSLQAEKQVLASRMQHAHAAVDVHKQRVTRLEEQVCFLDFEPISMSF
jgi:hypothetical protein